MKRRRFLVLAPGLAAALATAAPQTPLPLAADLQADGRDSRSRRVPIVILFSLPGCPYCEVVRRSHLAPMLRDPRESARAIIRQVDIDSDQSVVGFGGTPTTHAAIARAHGVRSAPVVAFLDGEGRPLADALKGLLLADFYSAYLDSALESARARLAGRG
jgi:thioredoxin-like negative regulator of GroEL